MESRRVEEIRAVFFIARPAGPWWPLSAAPENTMLLSNPEWVEMCGGPHANDVLSAKVPPPTPLKICEKHSITGTCWKVPDIWSRGDLKRV